MDRKKAERYLKISLFGAVLTLIGDLLIGAAKFPDDANLIDGYFAVALEMPAWRPVLGGLTGFAGICLEFPGLMTVYPLIREKMPRSGRFYKFAMYVYLAFGGGAVHLPCGAFMWIYRSAAEAAGLQAARSIAMQYLLYFLLPAAAVFGIFFAGANAVQFIAFIKGRTPFPAWYCVFNMMIGKAVFNSVRMLGNSALVNGIGTSNMSLSAIIMFTALLYGWRRYAGEKVYEI
ncbi:MAG: hypothetical protein K6G61_01680 [Solobacterium sp.]|nr:hypothetical protein [Solobacterium sp.]